MQLASNTYKISSGNKIEYFNYSCYLIKDDEYDILIDILPFAEYDFFLDKIDELSGLEKIKVVVISHFSPEVFSSLAALLKLGLNAKIVINELCLPSLIAANISADFYYISQNNNILQLPSGKVLQFIETPYLPFYESFVTYDDATGILFSSKLFGATPRKKMIYADQIFYKESMKAYHERIISKDEQLKLFMNILLKVHSQKPFQLIAPIHGAVIKDKIGSFIEILKNLKCGIQFNPIKNELSRKEGYIQLCNSILTQLSETFAVEQIRELFDIDDVVLDKNTLEILEFSGTGEELWQYLFNQIYIKKGATWIGLLYNSIELMVKNYNAVRPNVLTEREKEFVKIEVQYTNMLEEKEALEVNLKNTNEKLSKCPITMFYNQIFLSNFLSAMLVDKNPFSLLIIEIDDLRQIRNKYKDKSKEKINEMLKIMAEIFFEKEISSNAIFFKLNYEGAFACYLPFTEISNALIFGEELQHNIKDSSNFQEQHSISAGIIHSSEVPNIQNNADLLFQLGFDRLSVAKSVGANQICYQSSVNKYGRKKILVIENDEIYTVLIKNAFANNQDSNETDNSKDNRLIEIIFCDDGVKAEMIIEKDKPDLIISELYTSKINGLEIRQKMLLSADSRNIPFILTTHLKDEETLNRAQTLNIDYYLQKPFFINELTGLITKLIK